MIPGLGRAAGHLGPADLVRHLDGEGDAAERRRREDHLRRCPRCARDADRLARDSDAISAWLGAAAFEDGGPTGPAALATPAGPATTRPARPSAHRAAAARPWLRAAAIVLLLAAPLAAFPPARQWLAERVGLARGPDAATETAGATAPAEVIRFVPAPGEFVVVIDGRPAGGTLTLARAEGDDAVLETHGAVLPGPVVAADRVRLPASPGAASYVLRLPPAVTGVVLRSEAGEIRLGAAELDTARTIPLGPAR